MSNDSHYVRVPSVGLSSDVLAARDLLRAQGGQDDGSDDYPERFQEGRIEPSRVWPQSTAGDGSDAMFSLYSRIAKEKDDKMTEHWNHEATDGVLIFTGLFSAAVAALLTVSVQDLRARPESQDVSAFYLANIYQVLADPNVTAPRPSVLSTVATPPPFSPPRYAVWVNSLWFLSLVISFTCALLAMMLRQWAYRYTKFTQPEERYSPRRKAQMRQFFADGVATLRLQRVVEALPALIHLYMFLFFTGLAIFLFNTNHSVFISVIWWIGLSLMAYGWVTVMPIFWHYSPCYTPLSHLVWSLHAFLAYALCRVLAFITCRFGGLWTFESLSDLGKHYRDRMSRSMWDAAEENALKPSPNVFWRIWTCTISSVSDDSEKEEEAIKATPGFFQSPLAGVPLDQDAKHDVLEKFNGFLHRGLSSDLVSEQEKYSKLESYLNAMQSIFESDQVCGAISAIFRGKRYKLPQSIEMAYALAYWRAEFDNIALAVQCGIASILQAVCQRDPDWIPLAIKGLGILRRDLEDNLVHGDNSVSLVISIHMTRKVIRSTEPPDPDILSSLSEFDIRNTAPGLQHKFCDLWNEIIRTARGQVFNGHPVGVLRSTRQLYIGLHQGTDAAPTAFDASTHPRDPILNQLSSYPSCENPDHHPTSAVPLPTQIDDPPRLEGQPSPDGSARPQHAEEPSFPDHAPPAQESRVSLPSLTIDPVHIPPQPTLPAVPSVQESIRTLSLDLNRFVSALVSHFSPQSSLSTANFTTNIVPKNQPTGDIPINEMGESSQTTTATLLAHPHPRLVPVTITPPIAVHPTSVSVEQGEISDIPQPISSDLTSVYLQDWYRHQDITGPHDGSDITQISSPANQISQFIPSTVATAQRIEGSTRVPPTVSDSDPQSSLIMMLPPTSSLTLTELPPSVESALIQPDPLSHPIGSQPSILTTTRSHITQQVAPVLDVHVTTGVGTLGSREHYETRDPNPPTSMETSLQVQQPEPSTPP